MPTILHESVWRHLCPFGPYTKSLATVLEKTCISSKFRAEIDIWVGESITFPVEVIWAKTNITSSGPLLNPCQARTHPPPSKNAAVEDDGGPVAAGRTFTCTDSDGAQMTIRRRNERPISMKRWGGAACGATSTRLRLHLPVHPVPKRSYS
ncbi:hypothetical protein RhiJN_26426 [Ceratobasidium sp. AG-Ba]|nr:hypothetical protein RhiJN_26426 [Ceratobasidium sp. AG-Ba]